MNRIHCSRVDRHPAVFLPCQLRLAAFLSYIFLGAGTCVWAAPVTLQFRAVVGPPRQGSDGFLPPVWNTSLQEGDTINGTFTFEPFDAAPNTSTTMRVQPFDFSLRISTYTITTSNYAIEILNDHTFDDAPGPWDIINMGCAFRGGGTVCTPATISSTDPIEWTFNVGMLGAATLLDGADVPMDPVVWQQFQAYGMGVSFFDPRSNRYFGFSATPSCFQAIPEPNTLILVLIDILILVIVLSHRILHNNLS
jgi:hypothetical protein